MSAVSPLVDLVRSACEQLGWSGGLRPIQQEIVAASMAGQDVLAILPTGEGKSALYQVPALAGSGVVLVISPLIALMIDQQRRLEAHGVAVGALHTQRTTRQKREDLERLKHGNLDLVYLSPEKLSVLDPRSIEGVDVQMVAVDEIHAASEWGHDFRPTYRRIGEHLERLFPAGRPPLLGVTATATADVIQDVKSILRLPGERPLRLWDTSPDRSNIYYGVAGPQASVPRLVDRVGLPALVYGSTRRSVEVAASELRLHGFRADYYHAGRTKAERMEVQEAFQGGRLEVIAATNAFGMGVDKADIRGVVHLEMPTSMEAYVQESGRAGRDGEPAVALCRATLDTLRVARAMIQVQWPTPEFVRSVWHGLRVHFEGRRQGANAALPPGCLQGTLAEIGALLRPEVGGVPPELLGPALRVLIDGGDMRSIDAGELPVEVVLLSGSREGGPRQRQVVEAIEALADVDGQLWGSVRFFEEEIGLDRAYARTLSTRGALRVKWARSGGFYQLLSTDTLRFDVERLERLYRRQMERIDLTEHYLWQPGCRRDYLVRYFGHEVSPGSSRPGSRPGRCCDRCDVAGRGGCGVR